MYQVQISNRAAKVLEKLPDEAYERITVALRQLADNSRPPGYRKLKGHQAYRIRVGDYRVVYEIQDERLLVFIIDIGHRREIYR